MRMMQKNSTGLSMLMLAGVLALVGCGDSPTTQAVVDGQSPSSYPYQVTVTTGMVGDIVRHVAGEKVTITTLIGAGIDPHLYKPTRRDVTALQRANIIFYNGLLLEGKMTDTLGHIARGGKPVHAVTTMLDEQYLLHDEDDGQAHDPHVWMDVAAWSLAAELVAQKLAEFDPPNAQHYHDNAAGYREQLEQLHTYVHSVIGSIPESQRVLVTAHDAFRYFGRAYSIEVRGIQGLSTASEAGIQDINQLVEYLVSRGVGAVFVETSVPDRNVRALIAGAASRGHNVRIGGHLFSDAMGTAGTYEGTYVGMIDHNATTIARALDGEAPEGGMNGRLSAAKGH